MAKSKVFFKENKYGKAVRIKKSNILVICKKCGKYFLSQIKSKHSEQCKKCSNA